MSGHDANPTFFNKKKKKMDVQNTRYPHSRRPITSYFCLNLIVEPKPNSRIFD